MKPIEFRDHFSLKFKGLVLPQLVEMIFIDINWVGSKISFNLKI